MAKNKKISVSVTDARKAVSIELYREANMMRKHGNAKRAELHELLAENITLPGVSKATEDRALAELLAISRSWNATQAPDGGIANAALKRAAQVLAVVQQLLDAHEVKCRTRKRPNAKMRQLERDRTGRPAAA